MPSDVSLRTTPSSGGLTLSTLATEEFVSSFMQSLRIVSDIGFIRAILNTLGYGPIRVFANHVLVGETQDQDGEETDLTLTGIGPDCYELELFVVTGDGLTIESMILY